MEHRWLNSKAFNLDFVVLYSDRSLSTAALRRLQEERVRLCGWPNPGVFSFPDLAKNIVLHAKAKGNLEIEVPRALKAHEQLAILLEASIGSKTPLAKWKQFQSLSNLHKFDLNSAAYARIIQSLEDNQSEDLKDISNGVLSFLLLKKHQEENPTHLLTPWDWIPLAIEVMATHGDLNWDQIFFRPPKQGKFKLWIPTHKDIYPRERQLLDAVGKHVEVDYRFQKISTEKIKSLIPTKSRELSKNSVVIWAYNSEKPRPVETHELLSVSGQSIDIQVGKSDLRHLDLLPVFQWVNYHESGKAKLHPILRDFSTINKLEKLGIDYENAPSQEISRTFITTHYPDDLEAFDTIANYLNFQKEHTWELLVELKFFHIEDKTEKDLENLPFTHPHGIPVLALEDFPIMATADTLFWSDIENLKAQLQADSKATLSKQLFEDSLRQAIEAEGNSVPDARSEAPLISRYLSKWQEACAFLSLTECKAQQTIKTPEIESTIEVKQVSPTGLESYLNCPFRFYLERLLRLPEQIPWDNPNLRAANVGTWIHKVLEDFFKAPDFDNPTPIIDKLLEDNIEESFKENHSTAFLSLIRQTAKSFSQPLSEHILQFEKPLRQIVSIQKSLLENKMESNIVGYPMRGTVDRLDICDGYALLFDYKTGRFGEGSSSLIQKAKFQWFLYRRLVKEQMQLAVPAGGYINPIHPDKSRIFYFESDAQNLGALQEFLETSAFKVEVINEKKEAQINELIDENLAKISKGMKENNFQATPLNTQSCSYCNHKALCGRPYLIEGKQ